MGVFSWRCFFLIYFQIKSKYLSLFFNFFFESEMKVKWECVFWKCVVIPSCFFIKQLHDIRICSSSWFLIILIVRDDIIKIHGQFHSFFSVENPSFSQNFLDKKKTIKIIDPLISNYLYTYTHTNSKWTCLTTVWDNPHSSPFILHPIFDHHRRVMLHGPRKRHPSTSSVSWISMVRWIEKSMIRECHAP